MKTHTNDEMTIVRIQFATAMASVCSARCRVHFIQPHPFRCRAGKKKFQALSIKCAYFFFVCGFFISKGHYFQFGFAKMQLHKRPFPPIKHFVRQHVLGLGPTN